MMTDKTLSQEYLEYTDQERALIDETRAKIQRARASGDVSLLSFDRSMVQSADDLLRREFPPLDFIIPDYLPEGLTLLAGRPKVGKSWLALQLAVAIAAGGKIFNQDVKQGRVLFLALEDTDRRIQRRLKSLRAPANLLLDFVYGGQWPLYGEGGLSRLEAAMHSEKYRMAVMDTSARFMGRRQYNDYGEMSAVFGAVQEITMRQHCSMLLVDHHGKNKFGVFDPIDDVMASTAKTGTADGIMGLYRNNGSPMLWIRHRDTDEAQINVKFDGLTHCWQLTETGDGVKVGSVEVEYLDAIRAMRGLGKKTTVTGIAEYTGKNKGNVSNKLKRLVQRGILIKQNGEHYTADTVLAEQDSLNFI